MAAAFVAVPGLEAAALDGDRFGAAVLFDVAAFEVAALVAGLLAAVLFDAALVDRRAFFGELPFGSAFSIALPAELAAPPTAFPALVAASPTALPAVVAAPPTALPAPDAATLPAALLTVPAAFPTVFPTFFPTVLRILPVSGTFVLLIRPVVERSIVARASAVPQPDHAAGARCGATRATSCSFGSAPTMRSTG